MDIWLSHSSVVYSKTKPGNKKYQVMKNPWPLIEELKLPNTENKKSQVKGQKR